MKDDSITVAVTAREMCDDPAIYYQIKEASEVKDSVAWYMNKIFKDALDMALEDGFYPTEEFCLGQYVRCLLSGNLEDFVVDYLNVGGIIYFWQGMYPLFYTSDDGGGTANVIFLDEL